MYDYCAKNHELNPRNLSPSGRCRQCNRDYQRAHRNMIKTKLTQFEKLSTTEPRVPGQIG